MRHWNEFLTRVAETFWEWQSAVQVVFWTCPGDEASPRGFPGKFAPAHKFPILHSVDDFVVVRTTPLPIHTP